MTAFTDGMVTMARLQPGRRTHTAAAGPVASIRYPNHHANHPNRQPTHTEPTTTALMDHHRTVTRNVQLIDTGQPTMTAFTEDIVTMAPPGQEGSARRCATIWRAAAWGDKGGNNMLVRVEKGRRGGGSKGQGEAKGRMGQGR